MRMIFPLILLFWSCSRDRSAYEILPIKNPEFRPDTAFNSFEDLTNPKFEALKEKYQLDTIFHGETDELKRILLLRHWISTVIKIDDYGPYKGDGSVESIIDEGLKGNGFHCGHFTAVQNAVMNAYGYVTRCLLADVGVPVDYIVGGGHHAINEVWLNSYDKWFLSDAKYDYHFEKADIPLSALEVRDEYLKNKGADILLVKGPAREKTDVYPDPKTSKEQFASVYTWLSWGKYNDRYSNWPNTQTDFMLFYNDDYFKNHVWLWDGKRHWAYDTEYMILKDDSRAIEWTPNVIASDVTIKEDLADIHLRSATPNLRSYQMKEENGAWQDIDKDVQVKLTHDTNTLGFRTVNLAGVPGPEHKLVIAR
jgi:Transglutaminase-like superfamily